MNDSTIKLKNEILQWLFELEDKAVFQKIQQIKEDSEGKVCEPQAEYAVKDDFEERWKKGISLEESKARTIKFIESLPWKK